MENSPSPTRRRANWTKMLNMALSRVVSCIETGKNKVRPYLKKYLRYLARYGYDQYLVASATFIVLFAAACWVLADKPRINEELPGNSQNALAEAMVNATTRVNNSGADQAITLKDGSKVTFSTGGSISYPARYNESSRIVTLAGNAGFQVKKERDKPFLVYAGATVSKSEEAQFQVKAIHKDSLIHISVRSGEVLVFRTGDFDNIDLEAKKDRTGIVLQQGDTAVFYKTRQILTKKTPARKH